MHQKLTAPRALTALIARRLIRFATIIAACVVAAILVLSGILVYFFSPWWWLLALPFLMLFGLFLLMRVVVMIIVRVIHPNALTRDQKNAMNAFIDKIQVVLEAKSTPLFIVVLICLKDIVLHRDVVTIKNLVRDTASLRKEYGEIEKLF